jgi:transcription elongation factor GreA
MDMDKVPMTAEGYAALEAEIKYLKSVERPRIIKQIAEARTHGDVPLSGAGAQSHPAAG